jgi:diaminohydroxyphosphoribosylaminopyrimidine deaminase/5-amino-6-(5-phosphoribosylamino)uracil reductase
MRRALRLARRAMGTASPNPCVGAVVVKDGVILGQGYHRRPGEEHAEVLALRQAGRQARGATLYVNLEPCCFQGRTPPCTEEILRTGITRVVCAQEDPNPRVSGRGLARLRTAGLEVTAGVLESQARTVNEAYNKHISTGLPFVTVKIAQTLDGRIATRDGDSRWITSMSSRRLVHRLRSQLDAVLVGSGTVRCDDPLLNVRHVRGRDPVKVVLDSRLRTPLKARLWSAGRTIVATREGHQKRRILSYRDRGAEVWEFPPDADGRVDFAQCIRRLGREDIASVLVEGGRKVFTTALKSGLTDKLVICVSPRLLGDGKNAVGDLEIRRVAEALPVHRMKVRRLGPDVLITGRMRG